jgi:hypothetical protein
MERPWHPALTTIASGVIVIAAAMVLAPLFCLQINLFLIVGLL